MRKSFLTTVGITLIFACTIILVGCQKDQPETSSESVIKPLVVKLAPANFLANVTDEDVVIDVRTPEEYEAGHLEGARNIDVRSDDFRAGVELLDKDKTYYLYCRTGNRSHQAAEIMKDLGFEAVYNVGGFDELAEAGAETVRP